MIEGGGGAVNHGGIATDDGRGSRTQQYLYTFQATHRIKLFRLFLRFYFVFSSLLCSFKWNYDRIKN